MASGNQFSVKVKLHTYDTMSKCRSLSAGLFIQKDEDLAPVARELLHEIRNDFSGKKFSVRLLGIRCSNFRSSEEAAGGRQQKIDISSLVPVKSLSPAKITSPKRQKKTELNHIDKFLQSAEEMTIHTSDAEKKATKFVSCPICNRNFPDDDNEGLNQHIDSCLSGGLVKEVVREVNLTTQQRHKHPVQNFFLPKRMKK
jgi:hypothetical protein